MVLDTILAGFDGLDQVFLISVLLGGVVFVMRMVLSLFGGDGDSGAAADGADIDLDTDADFKMLSLQTLTAFFLMFGLSGLALHRSLEMTEGMSVLGAFAVGAGTMAIYAKMAQAMLRLQTSGTLDVSKAVGCTGIVYLTIPEGGGIGKVQVDIRDRLVEMDAMTNDKSSIKTGERIEVVEVINRNILVVKPFVLAADTAQSQS